MKKLLFAIATLPLFAAPLCAQSFIGVGGTASITRQYPAGQVPGSHAGGPYIEGATTLANINSLSFTVYGIAYDEPFAKGARPGGRFEARTNLRLTDGFTIFGGAGGNVINLPSVKKTIFHPVATAGFDIRGFAPRISYLFATGTNTGGIRYGADYLYRINGSHWGLRGTADSTRLHGRAPVIVVSAGVAYLF